MISTAVCQGLGIAVCFPFFILLFCYTRVVKWLTQKHQEIYVCMYKSKNRAYAMRSRGFSAVTSTVLSTLNIQSMDPNVNPIKVVRRPDRTSVRTCTIHSPGMQECVFDCFMCFRSKPGNPWLKTVHSTQGALSLKRYNPSPLPTEMRKCHYLAQSADTACPAQKLPGKHISTRGSLSTVHARRMISQLRNGKFFLPRWRQSHGLRMPFAWYADCPSPTCRNVMSGRCATAIPASNSSIDMLCSNLNTHGRRVGGCSFVVYVCICVAVYKCLPSVMVQPVNHEQFFSRCRTFLQLNSDFKLC